MAVGEAANLRHGRSNLIASVKDPAVKYDCAHQEDGLKTTLSTITKRNGEARTKVDNDCTTEHDATAKALADSTTRAEADQATKINAANLAYTTTATSA